MTEFLTIVWHMWLFPLMLAPWIVLGALYLVCKGRHVQ